MAHFRRSVYPAQYAGYFDSCSITMITRTVEYEIHEENLPPDVGGIEGGLISRMEYLQVENST